MHTLSAVHTQLIREALTEAQTDTDIIGLMLQGSLARGDGYAGSDLDLLVLLRDGCRRAFRAEERQRILVEWHYADYEKASAKVQANPMLAYGYMDGNILRDDSGSFAKLVHVAREVVENYRTPQAEWDGIRHWLHSASVKIKAATDAGDELKAAFIVATTSWKVLEGIWAANDLPMPPSGAVIAHRNDVTHVPNNWNLLFERVFTGENSERIKAMQTLIAWLLQQA